MTTDKTDEIKKDKFKNHFMFCCSHTCMIGAMGQFEKFYKKLAKVDRTAHTIEVGEDRFMFFVNINDHPEMIHGLTCVGFESCGNYDLSDEVIGYATSHLIKEAPVVDLRH
jgi:hypothetical protein